MNRMLFLGLLLFAATVAFTALAISDNLSNGPGHTVSVLGHDIATLGPLALFCSGLALALIFCLAMAMMVNGAHHHRGSSGMHGRHRRTTADPGLGPRRGPASHAS
ncbi:hypothetical protein A6P39_038740 [Streptomyces sp. FXJ1.172]|uniref:hypothetical protein n=1 Tax=Streptomyces sp. FXJ1.172 TaxID=710705 RepID=UPI001F3C39AB|nr:hypothetical protein [Streptomyces sp. FXJ1.172]WEO99509.1 hypothetical protein A6P39_038740 [Streptomyces sp. FXJ1.172]